MPPVNGILDNFTRADENPLTSPNWAGPIYTGNLQFRLISNVATSPAGGGTNSYWLPTVFGNDQEAFGTMVTLPATGGECGVWLRVTNPGNGSTMSGVEVVYVHGTGWYCVEFFNGTSTALATGTNPFSGSMSAGDKFRASIAGATVTLEKFTGGSWATVTTWTLTKSYSGGAIGMHNNSTIAAIDDFGGGDLYALDNALPDADVTTTGWTSTPLWSKVNDSSDASVIQATAS